MSKLKKKAPIQKNMKFFNLQAIKQNIQYIEKNLTPMKNWEFFLIRWQTLYSIIYLLSEFGFLNMPTLMFHILFIGFIPFGIACLTSSLRRWKEIDILYYRGSWPNSAPENITASVLLKKLPTLLKWAGGGISLITGTSFLTWDATGISPVREIEGALTGDQKWSDIPKHYWDYKEYRKSDLPPFIQDKLQNYENLEKSFENLEKSFENLEKSFENLKDISQQVLDVNKNLSEMSDQLIETNKDLMKDNKELEKIFKQISKK